MVRIPTRQRKYVLPYDGGRSKAENRAYRLLCTFLTFKQRKSYAEWGFFDEVVGEHICRIYAFDPTFIEIMSPQRVIGKKGFYDEFYIEGDKGFFVEDNGSYPLSDQALALLLHLRANRRMINRVACGNPDIRL